MRFTLICVLLIAPLWSAPAGGSKVRAARNEKLHSLHPQVQRVVVPTEQIPEVIRMGGHYLSMVSDDLALVSRPSSGDLAAGDTVSSASKMSEALSGQANYVVVFHPDVSSGDADSILKRVGVSQFPSADLLPHQFLVAGSREQAVALSSWDEVAYIYPASQEMFSGIPLYSCAGPLIQFGPVGQYIATFGDGWDGPGQGRADLTYSFEKLTDKLPQSVIQTAVEKAAAEWSRAVNVRFSPSSTAMATRNINVVFASGSHGDSYPFDGQGKVLAHTFYPPPVNSEPIAGDLHLDEDELWGNGGDVDLYSVVLHELGHALGLGHSDRPQAVMYPYYRNLSTLQSDDIAAIQRLYSATDSPTDPTSSAPAPAPAASPNPALTLTVQAPESVTRDTLDLSGSVVGGAGEVQVTWISGTSGGLATGGRNWSVSGIPLITGQNAIRIAAQDLVGNSISRSVVVVRTIPESAPAPVPAPSAPVPSIPVSVPTPAPQAPAAPAPVAPAAPATALDNSPPIVTITVPSVGITSTSSATAHVAGSARDDIGVASVSWSSLGRTGTATGTTNWSFDIPLYGGDNPIVVRATDAAGNSSWRSLTITRR